MQKHFRFQKSLLSALPLLLWLFFLMKTEPPLTVISVLLATVVHEIGHTTAFFCLGHPCPRIKLHALGLSLKPQRMLSYKQEALICFCGPLANLLLAALLCFMARLFPALLFTAKISLLLGFIHLLPIFPLDGGRMLLSLACSLFGFSGGVFITEVTSLSVLLIAAFTALYFMLSFGVALPLFLSCVFLFSEQSGIATLSPSICEHLGEKKRISANSIKNTRIFRR